MKKRKSYRVNDEDFEIIKEKAKICNMTISEYIRTSALQQIIIIKNFEQHKELVLAINRIGTNINQLVKLSNTVGTVDKNDLIKIEESLIKIFKKLNEF